MNCFYMHKFFIQGPIDLLLCETKLNFKFKCKMCTIFLDISVLFRKKVIFSWFNLLKLLKTIYFILAFHKKCILINKVVQ